MQAEPLHFHEVAAVAAAVPAVWCTALLALHLSNKIPTFGSAIPDNQQEGFWGTLPSAWDHPEPNYLVSGVVGEFWSVLTTIPVAGALLLYLGLRFGYGSKVMAIYAVTCCMYSLAFTAHLTLQMHIFSTTVIAVMSNALLTFVMFSHVVHRALESVLLRGAIVIAAETVLVTTVATLPYRLEHGGVWTLFIVQAPGVFLATALAGIMARTSHRAAEKATYGLVTTAGSLLSSAMVLSLVECLVGFEWGFIERFWGFPWLHIAIHMLEQVGIYVFGVGVAALEALLLRPDAFKGAEVRYLGWFVYLYYPGKSEPLTGLLKNAGDVVKHGASLQAAVAMTASGALQVCDIQNPAEFRQLVKTRLMSLCICTRSASRIAVVSRASVAKLHRASGTSDCSRSKRNETHRALRPKSFRGHLHMGCASQKISYVRYPRADMCTAHPCDFQDGAEREETLTVGELKEEIERCQDVPAYQQELICGSEVLADNACLRQVAKSHDVELQLVVQDRRCGIHLGKLVDGAYCSSGCYGTVDGAFLMKGANEYVKWPIQLPGNFSVHTRFRVAHSELTAVLFVFWDTAPKGARHPYFQSHQMDCDGSWLDQIGFVVNRQGSHILKSGAHWGSAVLFPGEVMEPQEWCGEWHDVSLQRHSGQLTVTVDGKTAMTASMTWRVAAVGLRPHHESRSAIQIQQKADNWTQFAVELAPTVEALCGALLVCHMQLECLEATQIPRNGNEAADVPARQKPSLGGNGHGKPAQLETLQRRKRTESPGVSNLVAGEAQGPEARRHVRSEETEALQTHAVSSVVDLLKAMSKTIAEENGEDQKSYEKLQCWCSAEKKEKTQTIDEGAAKLTEIESSLESLAASRASQEIRIKELQQQVAEGQGALEKASAVRQDQKEKFDSYEADTTTYLVSLKAAIEVLTKKTGQTALPQVSAFMQIFSHPSAATAMPSLGEESEADSLPLADWDDFRKAEGPETERRLRGSAEGLDAAQGWSAEEEAAVNRGLGVAMSFAQSAQGRSVELYSPGSTGELIGMFQQMLSTMEASRGNRPRENQAAVDSEELRQARLQEIHQATSMVDLKKRERAHASEAIALAKADKKQLGKVVDTSRESLATINKRCEDSERGHRQRMEARSREDAAILETIQVLTDGSTVSFLQLTATSKTSGSGAAEVLAMTQSDSFGKVRDAIDGMVRELKQQQRLDVKKKDWCKQEFFENQKAANAAADHQTSLELRSSEMESDIKTLQGDLDHTRQKREELKGQLQTASEERREEQSAFQKTKWDQQMTLRALRQAFRKLSGVYAPSSFLSRPREAAGYHKNQMGGTVLKLLQTLMADAQDVVDKAALAENQAEVSYGRFVEETKTMLESLQANTVAKSRAIATSKKDFLQTGQDVRLNAQEQHDLAVQKANLKAQCDSLIKNFDEISNKRQSEIEALTQSKVVLAE
ncbi:unnamed protein product [Symbiodinium necroappetens]|uniref:Ubiquitin-like domain-containing protein n=1 Tax=Symbiodinium necroappetens TaxID=1628268 RepID=A0A813AKD8_9DINO|nr:unnamed protein product [Symbiodinium necroappetens]